VSSETKTRVRDETARDTYDTRDTADTNSRWTGRNAQLTKCDNSSRSFAEATFSQSSTESRLMNSPQLDRSTSARCFSTDAYAPHERVAAWREAYGETIAKLEFEPVSEGPFAVEATLRALPGVAIATMSTQGLRFTKPRNLIDSDDLILVTMESGVYSGSQLGRDVKLEVGDAVVRLNAEVTTGEIMGRPSIIRVPTKAIAPMVGDISAGIHRRIPADNDALRLLRPYVRAMQDSATTPELQHLAASHVHDLFALLLGATRDGADVARRGGAKAARLKAIKDDIESDTGQDISIGTIAARHRVTPRYVQLLFEGDGTTFTEYVHGVRLAHAHRMLTNPRYSDQKISAIAFDVGFGDLSYFIRVFRRRYGATPSDVRAQTQRDN
jgi:AraC-like DNA-binding protein